MRNSNIQEYRQFETVQYNRILNTKLTNEMWEILRHFDKVSKISFKTILPLKHWLTIGLLDTGMSNHWTVWHSIIQLLESWTQDCPTIGQLEKAQSDHWTVGQSDHKPSDSWTQHKPTIGLLETTLSNCWTQHCPIIEQFDKTLSDNCPTIGILDTVLSKHLHN